MSTLLKTPSSATPKPKVPLRMIPPSLDEMRKHEDFDEDVELLELEGEGSEGLVVSESAFRVSPTHPTPVHYSYSIPAFVWFALMSGAQQLSKIATREPSGTTLALRLAVESGGCHGYQYKMELDDDGAGVGD